MLPAHKRFLLLEEGVGSIVVNLLINGVIAFFMFRGAAAVPLWGQQSIAGDTIGTALLLPLFTCLIVTPLARRQVRAGAVPPLAALPAAMRWLPRGTFRRGLLLGALTVASVAPATIAALTAGGVTQQSFWGFVAFKAIFAAALGAVVTPLIALYAIAGEAALPAD
ncbi:MAG: hypothetical protein HY699_17630 [Deltaproteobacteria bacterium]|nr:hypothetical protein [Deltaproteobacteria bacterium]